MTKKVRFEGKRVQRSEGHGVDGALVGAEPGTEVACLESISQKAI